MNRTLTDQGWQPLFDNQTNDSRSRYS